MSNNKFESLLELLINEENDKAEALFHEIVVEKSRDIYENLADEEVTAEAMHDKKMKKEDEVTETETSKDEKVEETAEEKVEETTDEAKDEEVKETSDEAKDEQVDEVVEIEDEATESETTEEESIEDFEELAKADGRMAPAQVSQMKCRNAGTPTIHTRLSFQQLTLARSRCASLGQRAAAKKSLQVAECQRHTTSSTSLPFRRPTAARTMVRHRRSRMLESA